MAQQSRFATRGEGSEVLRPLILVDEATDEIVARGCELLSMEIDDHEEDELELLYLTKREFYQFGGSDTVQTIRTTSFGCGKLGHQVWPSALALALVLTYEYSEKDKPLSVMELGAGCGLPSVVCRDVLKVPSVVATDFWYVDEGMERDWKTLMPEKWHGINLEYNVAKPGIAKVQQFDWRYLQNIQDFGRVDIVIGSDTVYDPVNIQPLWNTIENLLRDCEVSKILLVFPLEPAERKALPEFLELVDSKTTPDGDFVLEKQRLILYESYEDLNAKKGGENFLKITLSKSN